MQIQFAALLFACFFAGLFALTAGTTSHAATTLPTKMNFQGRVTNSAGNILSNGTYNMKFRIWSAASGGTQQWSEDRLVSAGQGVTVTNGQFSVQLGSVTSLPASIFASNSLYFEIELPTPASATGSSPVWSEGAMTPRNQLATSAYAFNSETLDGLDSAAFGQLDQNNVFTGNNTFNGTLQGGSSLTLGTTSVAGSLVISDGSSNTGTIAMAPTAGNYTYTIPVTTANDSFCLQTLANCADGGVTTVGALDGGTANATGASIVGTTIYLQSASAANAGLVNTTTQSFAGNKTFTGTVAVSGTTTLNDNVTVAANKTIQYVGGATASRPAAPGEGTTFYDTDTKQLLVYANGKWNADKSSSTKIVAASNSSQALKDAADYVADGNTAAANDGDQVEINNALTAAAGGRVYLAEGTYTIDASISVPDNTTLAGSGQGTVITIPNALNTNFKAIVNSGSVTLTIQDLRLDGNKANQSGANFGMAGIVLSGMNTGSGSSVRRGPLIQNVNSSQWYVNGSVIQCSNSGVGICLSTTRYATIADSFTNGNRDGIYITGSPSYATVSGHVGFSNDNGVRLDNVSYATIESSTFHSNISNGIAAFTAANYNNINGNNIYANAIGVSVSGANNNFSGNTSQGNTGAGFSVSGNNNLFSANTAYDNGGATTNNGFSITSSGSGNSIIGNTIGDTSATTNNYAITITSANASSTYLSGNVLGSGSINDVSSSTVYASQVDASGSLINRNQGGVSVGKTTAGTTLDVQGAIRNVALSTPTAPTLSTSGTAGSTTYGYRVSALDGLGETLASTEATIATGNATLSATDYVNITWPQVGGAVQYKVYRSTSAGTPSTTGLIRTVAGNVLTTTDTGLAASGSVAASNTTGGASFGGAMQGGSSLTLGTSSVQGSLVLNDGNGQTGTIRMADIAGNYTYTIPVTTANDTFCMQTLANCSGGGITTIGALDGGSANATGASIVGSTIYLQSASTSNAGLVNTTTQSFAGNKTFTGTVTVSGATTLNDNVVVATGKTIQFVGGATNTRPASPGEGSVYYDTTTKQLLTYTGSRWQSSKDAITKIVAASNSSQTMKDAADYVADGTGDDVEINAALTAATGGTVYLAEGTYTAAATILVPNSTVLSGAGSGTLIQLADLDVTDNLIENTDTTTGTAITLRDFRIDGQKTLNTAGTQHGISLTNMGGGTGSGARVGARISNVVMNNFRNYGLTLATSQNGNYDSMSATGNTVAAYQMTNSDRNVFTGNKAFGNGSGFNMSTTDNSTFTANVVEGSTNEGFSVGNSTNNTFTSNTTNANTNAFYVSASTDNTFGSNSIQAPTTSGFNLTLAANSNIISGNRIVNSGGATVNNAIYIAANSDTNTVTGNQISDSSATSNNYAINLAISTDDGTYLADNVLGGGSINDAGTGTIYASQTDASGNLVIQPAANINLNKNTVISSGSLTLGNASTAGNLVISDGSSNTATIAVGNLAGNYTYTIPVTTANDTFCLVTLANCTGAGSGVTAVGALDGGTANATGASIVGTTIYLQSASATNAGLVNTTTQSFAGNKTFTGALAVSAGAPPAADMLSISNAGQGVTTAGVSGIEVNYVGGSAAVEASGVRVDLTPGGTSGGTWSGLRIVANATGAASGVTENGLKIEGPTSPGAGTETGMYIGTGWDIGADIQSGGIQLATQSDPSAPAAGNLKLYAKSVAGRVVPKVIGPSGINTPLQNALWQNNTVMWVPSTAAGTWQGTNGAAVGTAAIALPATTNFYTQTRRSTYAPASAAANIQAGIRTESMFFSGNTAGSGGFFAAFHFGLSTWTAGDRLFVGFSAATGTAITTVNPSTLTNTIGFGVDAGDTAITFMHNDGTGTAVKDTIAGQPALASNQGYDAYIFVKPNDTTVYYRIDNTNTGATIIDTSTNTDVAAVNTMLAAHAAIGTGTNTTIASALLGINRIYVETDR